MYTHLSPLASRPSALLSQPCLGPRTHPLPRPLAACTAPAVPDAGGLKRIRAVVAPRRLPDEDLVVHEVESVHMRLTQCETLPTHVSREEDLASYALLLTDLMATGSVFRTLQILKRCPDLLYVGPSEMVHKMLQLKALLPQSNIGELLYQKPSLLLMPDLPGTLGPALKKLRALIPGIPVEKKLHEGGTVWWSFSSLLDGFTSGQQAGSKGRSSSSSSSTGGGSNGS